ncbi:CBS domain-containing protein [Streptosporangium sp. NPDC023825]|uniref:CBS domain-containing protein n=1 Tax=Streptosporangium sp. NPDC023825 TaxID=3154909 RepID=UPI00341974FC
MGERLRRENEPLAWLIRGGRDGEGNEELEDRKEDKALAEGLAVIGWRELGDIGHYAHRDDLKEEVRRAYPKSSPGVIANWAGQLWRFSKEIQEGDLVVMPRKRDPKKVAIGRVIGPYEYRQDEAPGFRQVRRVEWIHTDIPRDIFKSDLRASTTSLLTVCGLSRNDAARRIAHLAEYGVDPGVEGQEEITTAADLLEDAVSRNPQDPRKLTIRDLLEHWGTSRRTGSAIEAIKSDLAAQGLTTQPPFTEGSVDTEVALVRLVGEPDVEMNVVEDADDIENVFDYEPMTLRLGGLPAPLVSVPKSAKLKYAKTLMLTKNFSQLAVVDEDGTFHGAISWESIGHAHVASADPTLQEALTAAVVVDHDALLLDQIEVIYEKGYIFVRSADRSEVTGIITAADLTRQFGYHARPFILIEEAENRLRRAAEVFSVDDLKQAVTPHQRSKVRQAADLTFGNYFHLLKDQGRWEVLGWNVDQEILLEYLEEVRKARNELMHFSPDPLSPTQYAAVHGLLAVLRAADPRP